MRELDKTYYNYVFATSSTYNCHYTQSPYLGLWEMMIPSLSRDELVIDLGCGPGQFARCLYINGFKKYMGIDFSGVAIRKALQLFENVEGFSFLEQDLKRGTIPIAMQYVACEFLEHIGNDLEILEKLPDKCVLVGSVPDFDCKGHVRYFAGKDDIERRYGNILNFDVIESFNQHWFYFKAKKGVRA